MKKKSIAIVGLILALALMTTVFGALLMTKTVNFSANIKSIGSISVQYQANTTEITTYAFGEFDTALGQKVLPIKIVNTGNLVVQLNWNMSTVGWTLQANYYQSPQAMFCLAIYKESGLATKFVPVTENITIAVGSSVNLWLDCQCQAISLPEIVSFNTNFNANN